MSSIVRYPTPFSSEAGGSGSGMTLVPPDPLRVLVADAEPVIRAGFAAILAHEPDIIVCAEAASVEEAATLTGRLRPDVVLLDLDLPGEGGVEATRRIGELEGSVSVIVLAPHDGDLRLFAALRAGARGFIVRNIEPEDLVEAVRSVAGGEAYLTPGATRRVIAEFASQPQPPLPATDQLDELTAREREVMALLAAGLRNDEIAARFVISPATVKTHISSALRKLNVRDRAQLVAMAYRSGLVRPLPQRANGFPTALSA
jgi:DNA-binding NarL/FixJ family response regulator